MKKVLLLAAIAMLGTLALAPAAFAQSRGPSGADGTYNCSDFDTQQQAQQFFLANNPSQDPNGLDGPEGHASTGTPGVACENLPGPQDLTPAPGYPGGTTQPPITTTQPPTTTTQPPTTTAPTTTQPPTTTPVATPTTATTPAATTTTTAAPAAASSTTAALPDTGGPVLLLPAAGLLLVSGLLMVGLRRRD